MSKRRNRAVTAATEPDRTDRGATPPGLPARVAAEVLGTFVLVFGGCGAAVLAGTAQNPDGIQVGIGYLGVALAFGLAVMAAAVAFGAISGGHFNPAITVAATLIRRIDAPTAVAYVVAQVVGASLAGLVLFVIASGRPGFDAMASGFASNGYGDRSPAGYGLVAALVIEIALTAVFVGVVLAATEPSRALSWAPVAVGLTLTVVHLVAIPVTNTSVNPARSLGVAWFAGPAALGQVWLFVLAPVVGAVIAAVGHRALSTAARA